MSQYGEQQGCIGEKMLSDIDLLAAIDGEASLDVIEHLAACPCCSDRARLLSEVQRYLQICLARSICPSTLTLIDFYLRLLDPAQHRAVSAHLMDCPSCANDLAQIVAASAPLPLYRYVQTP